uniref:Uncharacterized protein n=1 Tax=Eutreptiella gymnastica TaxID=73025 RepID=A0A7S1NP13_9EUGL|mmetsp:Transcript_65116/g.115884  ORF Transcript_65116/g.115884 Transcript_65116/m.115884 type:complete len:110 (+) Transcript_65116:2456-2785(+)
MTGPDPSHLPCILLLSSDGVCDPPSPSPTTHTPMTNVQRIVHWVFSIQNPFNVDISMQHSHPLHYPPSPSLLHTPSSAQFVLCASDKNQLMVQNPETHRRRKTHGKTTP